MTFYFTLKALFVLKIFRFLSWRFGQIEKRLDQKDTVIFKTYDIQPGKQTIQIHIIRNISKSKGN